LGTVLRHPGRRRDGGDRPGVYHRSDDRRPDRRRIRRIERIIQTDSARKDAVFYTATILLLYTANDLTTGSENVLTRVFYNVVGITIGVLVVIYPFPRMLKMINPKATVE
jgi:hypothetical protein